MRPIHTVLDNTDSFQARHRAVEAAACADVWHDEAEALAGAYCLDASDWVPAGSTLPCPGRRQTRARMALRTWGQP